MGFTRDLPSLLISGLGESTRWQDRVSSLEVLDHTESTSISDPQSPDAHCPGSPCGPPAFISNWRWFLQLLGPSGPFPCRTSVGTARRRPGPLQAWEPRRLLLPAQGRLRDSRAGLGRLGPRQRLRRRLSPAAAPYARLPAGSSCPAAAPPGPTHAFPARPEKRRGQQEARPGRTGPGPARALAPGWASRRLARRRLTALLSSPLGGWLRPLRAPGDGLLLGGRRLGHLSASQSPAGVGGALRGGPSPQVGRDAGEGRLCRLPFPFVLGGAAGRERLRLSPQKHGGQDPLTGPLRL
ncbi:uncharacterized protein PHA67_006640 [Liasis olivaceus]